jgi:hypothetical protein
MECYQNLAAPQWMRQALLSLTKVPDLPTSDNEMLGEMVPVMTSRVWKHLIESPPLFVNKGASRAETHLYEGSMYYPYMIKYETYEAAVAEALDLPSFKGSVDRSLKILTRAREPHRFLFLDRPDPIALYKLLIKIVFIRLLTESPYMAAQYREMLRYGAQQSAFRKGVVSDARAALLALLDATAVDHNRKADAQNKSDRAAADAVLKAELKATEDAAKAAQARVKAEAARKAADKSLADSLGVSKQLNDELDALRGQVQTASRRRSEADRELDAAKLFRTTRVEKSREQAEWERKDRDRALKSFQTSDSMANALPLQIADLERRLSDNIGKLMQAENEARARESSALGKSGQELDRYKAAKAAVAFLTAEQVNIRDAIKKLNDTIYALSTQTDSDRRDAGTISTALAGLGPVDPSALTSMKTQLEQIQFNTKNYLDKRDAALERKAKNEACLARVPADWTL